MSYVESFSYVANIYFDALKSKDWTCGLVTSVYTVLRSGNQEENTILSQINDELCDHMAFLASVANDAW